MGDNSYKEFMNIWENVLWPIIETVAIIVLGWLATKLIVFIITKALKKKDVDPSLVNFFRRVTRVACYVIIAIAVLNNLEISTTGIVACFSAAAAAIAIALRDSLANMLSGIVILFTKPFVTGDFIEFGEFKGYVQKIDMIHTDILTYSHTNVVIPNSQITTSQLVNYTTHPEVRVQISVPIPYSADFDEVKKLILEVIYKTENVLFTDEYEPKVRLENYLESSLEVLARCYTRFENYWPVYYSLTENIKKKLEENGISIPFNQLDVHIVENVDKG